MKILIDTGHGQETLGKRSPDGLFREYAWAREIASRLEAELHKRGYEAQRIVPEANDVPLKERSRRVNEICGRVGEDNVIFVSVHVNAASDDGSWMNARGWSAYTSKGETRSDKLATCLYRAAEAALTPAGIKIRKDMSDGDPDWEENFWVLRKTLCPAVLTENLFMDNRDDLAFLNSERGKQAIVDLHIKGIINFINSGQ